MSFWLEATDSFGNWLENEFEYACFYCDLNFQLESNLFRHIKVIHRVSEDKYQLDNPFYRVTTQPFRCHICEEEVEHVTKHINGRHNMETELYFVRFVYAPALVSRDEDQEERYNNGCPVYMFLVSFFG